MPEFGANPINKTPKTLDDFFLEIENRTKNRNYFLGSMGAARQRQKVKSDAHFLQKKRGYKNRRSQNFQPILSGRRFVCLVFLIFFAAVFRDFVCVTWLPP